MFPRYHHIPEKESNNLLKRDRRVGIAVGAGVRASTGDGVIDGKYVGSSDSKLGELVDGIYVLENVGLNVGPRVEVAGGALKSMVNAPRCVW